MALRDLLAEEVEDGRRAAEAAVRGGSITGFPGRGAAAGDVFGDVVEPIAAKPVEGLIPRATAAAQATQADDVFLRRSRAGEQRERKPFGAGEQVLAWPIRPGYRRYWFSDMPGRIARAKQAGYEHVHDADGSPVARVTDRADGRGRSSYLMETPIQWYQEDMGRQAADLAQRLNDIRRGQAGPGATDQRYIPKQGISIVGR